MPRRGGEGQGDQEVSPISLSTFPGDLSGAGVRVCSEEEGDSRGKHGFPRATERQARAFACMVVAGRKAA